jgi:hypothetical protein
METARCRPKAKMWVIAHRFDFPVPPAPLPTVLLLNPDLFPEEVEAVAAAGASVEEEDDEDDEEKPVAEAEGAVAEITDTRPSSKSPCRSGRSETSSLRKSNRGSA